MIPPRFNPQAVTKAADAISRKRYLSHQISNEALVVEVLETYQGEKPRCPPRPRTETAVKSRRGTETRG